MVKLSISMSPMCEAGARLKFFDRRSLFAPIDPWRGQPRQVDRHIVLARQRGQARDVIGMLMRDDDRGQALRLFADRGQAARQFPQAQARIHQDARPLRGYERRIPRTTAGQDAEFYDERPPSHFG